MVRITDASGRSFGLRASEAGANANATVNRITGTNVNVVGGG